MTLPVAAIATAPGGGTIVADAKARALADLIALLGLSSGLSRPPSPETSIASGIDATVAGRVAGGGLRLTFADGRSLHVPAGLLPDGLTPGQSLRIVPTAALEPGGRLTAREPGVATGGTAAGPSLQGGPSAQGAAQLAAALSLSPKDRAALAATLESMAARQAPSAPALATLSALIHTGDGGNPAIRALARLIAPMILDANGMREPGMIEGPALARAVALSGVFHEALAVRTGSAPLDLKQVLAALLGTTGMTPGALGPTNPADAAPAGVLARAAPPMPGDGPAPQRAVPIPDAATPAFEQALATLPEAADAGLKRIGLTQIAMLTEAASPTDGAKAVPVLTTEVPVRIDSHVTTLAITVARDGRSGNAREPATPAWSVRFAVDLPDQGAVHGLVRLKGQEVSASLFVERPETRNSLLAALPTLARALGDQAFTIGDLTIEGGARAATRSGMGRRTAQFLDRLT